MTAFLTVFQITTSQKNKPCWGELGETWHPNHQFQVWCLRAQVNTSLDNDSEFYSKTAEETNSAAAIRTVAGRFTGGKTRTLYVMIVLAVVQLTAWYLDQDPLRDGSRRHVEGQEFNITALVNLQRGVVSNVTQAIDHSSTAKMALSPPRNIKFYCFMTFFFLNCRILHDWNGVTLIAKDLTVQQNCVDGPVHAHFVLQMNKLKLLIMGLWRNPISHAG